MKEIWTTEAKNTFKNNIEYLKNKWTSKEIEMFVLKSFEVIDLLKKYPEMGIWDTNHQSFKFLLLSQIYLFYYIDNDNFVLLSLWNNYQKSLQQ